MSSLYQIDQQIMACCDTETGEVIDPEKLDALLLERDAKIEGVALWIKNLRSDAEAYKAEKDAFAEREKKAREKADKLTEWLTDVLQGQKFQTAKCAVSFRRSTSVDVMDIAALPEHLLTIKTTTTANKPAIARLLKEGQTVPGCVLTENQNISIK